MPAPTDCAGKRPPQRLRRHQNVRRRPTPVAHLRPLPPKEGYAAIRLPAGKRPCTTHSHRKAPCSAATRRRRAAMPTSGRRPRRRCKPPARTGCVRSAPDAPAEPSLRAVLPRLETAASSAEDPARWDTDGQNPGRHNLPVQNPSHTIRADRIPAGEIRVGGTRTDGVRTTETRADETQSAGTRARSHHHEGSTPGAKRTGTSDRPQLALEVRSASIWAWISSGVGRGTPIISANTSRSWSR